jgi:hypothetical protein
MKLVIATQEMLESLIDSSVSRAVKNAYIQKENEKVKKNLKTIKEASIDLSVSILTIRNYIDRGILEGKKIGNRVLISSDSIENALQEVKSLKYKR